MKEFISAFQLSRLIIFEVDYYTLYENGHARFSTSAAELLKNKLDYKRAGQCQNDLLKDFPVAMSFFKKWDVHHLHDLTEEQYADLRKDMEVLKEEYNYMEIGLDENAKPYNPYISFSEIREFSKQKPKHKNK